MCFAMIRQCLGSQGYYHGRKLYKIHEMALDMGVPLVGLNDSPGARVIRPELAGSDDPYRVSDEKSAGVVFYINTRCSGAVPQISAILGNCTGGSVYSPAPDRFYIYGGRFIPYVYNRSESH